MVRFFFETHTFICVVLYLMYRTVCLELDDDLYTSVSKMTNFVHLENSLLDKISKKIDEFNMPDYTKGIIQNANFVNREGDPEQYISNSLVAHRLLGRLCNHWSLVLKQHPGISGLTDDELRTCCSVFREVTYSMYNIILFYGLDKYDLQNGHLFGTPLLVNEYDEIVKNGQTIKEKKINAGDDLDTFSTAEDFKYLCREALYNHVSAKGTKSRLTCYTKFNIQHGWLVEMEDVQLDPRIVLFHNVISEAEIENLKSRSAPWLHRSVIQSQGDDGRRGYRTSQSAWMSHLKHPVVAKLDKRAEALTGLSVKKPGSAFFNEPFQVLNYGIGGQYKPHLDSFRQGEHLHNNDIFPYDRIATLMFYLTDVPKGGATVFTKLGVFAKPVKGAAVLWYNSNRNGETDNRLQHGSCPVVVGSKWGRGSDSEQGFVQYAFGKKARTGRKLQGIMGGDAVPRITLSYYYVLNYSSSGDEMVQTRESVVI